MKALWAAIVDLKWWLAALVVVAIACGAWAAGYQLQAAIWVWSALIVGGVAWMVHHGDSYLKEEDELSTEVVPGKRETE